MTEFKLTAKARQDLALISRYTEKRWGRRQRYVYLKQLDDAFHYLVESPMAGLECDDIRYGYRKLPCGSHLIFYKAEPQAPLEVIRVLHKSMDVNSHF